MASDTTATSVLDFWLADGSTPTPGWPSKDMKQLWFTGGPEVDQQISRQFGAQVALALAGGLKDWEPEPLSRLALVILLDQFTRNIFRGNANAFSGDARAQQLVSDALAQGVDEQLSWVGRVFMYMPLMHAEHLALQEESVRRFTRLARAVPETLRDKINSNLGFATQHRDIIARFGRFPYRNAALGRTSSALEFDFLKIGPRFGQ